MIPKIEDDPRVQKAAEHLFNRLTNLLVGQPMTTRSVGEAAELVLGHRKECLKLGIQFPKLTVVPLPGQNVIEVVRADMDQLGINQTILNMTVKYPKITPREIAEAITTAFPHLRPKDVNAEQRRTH